MHTLPNDSPPPEENPAQTTASQVPLSPSRTIVIGLSGPSSSGKTTLARLLRSVFNVDVGGRVEADVDGKAKAKAPGREEKMKEATEDEGYHKLSLFILHQDDFYKTDKDVPWVTISSSKYGTRTDQDWDCVGSLDLPLFRRTLTHIRDHGTLPPDNVSMEDQNSVGDVHVTPDEVEAVKRRVKDWFERVIRDSPKSSKTRTLTRTNGAATATTTAAHEEVPREIRICILEGFLLFPPSPSDSSASFKTAAQGLAGDETTDLLELHDLTQSLLDVKLFLPCTKAQMIERRERRTGYVTLEGFWKDPPGYVEDLVWVNYRRYHAWMYRDHADNGDGDGEGEGEGEGGRKEEGHHQERDTDKSEASEEFDEEKCGREGVHLFLTHEKGVGEGTMKECLDWGVERVQEALTDLI
ncbi:hypothetical protein PV08_05795 [Exophiala spinifera]|uniref:Nicotinamide riboside kinase n=1 Tax=Exophiala spinifera TaxID=91928 RepID=A0A0D2BAW7_9EURO|nr:uncharacterized protein PV08_05795 [Exophiala spinifera]KIW15745.1 hypothetical protein PV08_05795 [Exophiala spinifera]